jgi:hypothetical protein
MAGIFQNMANQIISQLVRIGTQYMLLLAVKQIFSGVTGGFGGFLIHALGGHEGGTFERGRKMGGGGSFVVPGGFQNDSFPVMVESGERVTVTPASRVTEETVGYQKMLQKLDILNMNLAGRNKVSGSIAVQVGGSLQGKDIYLSNKKSTRVYTRIR